MLESLDIVPWSQLEHAYGAAADLPDNLRQLLSEDPKVRSQARRALYGNVYHQGTRYPATPYVIPFLIELCSQPQVPERGALLRYWGFLITGFFSVRERPTWGDGITTCWAGNKHAKKADDPYDIAVHQVYIESLKGQELLYRLLNDVDHEIRAFAAWVLACLPTIAEHSVAHLQARIIKEESGWARAAICFALGELGDTASLKNAISSDDFPAVQCMSACELARIAPEESLTDTLLKFVAQPIDGYDTVPGAGGKSTGDAAFSISQLPATVQQRAIPTICDRLDSARSFDTMPLVTTLLSAAFPNSNEPVVRLSPLQRHVLSRMVDNEELWQIGNLMWVFKSHGLNQNRQKCAELVGVRVAEDPALRELRGGLAFAEIGFLDKGREGILRALSIDPAVFERAPEPAECWLLCAKAFAANDPDRAVTAFNNALAINPLVRGRVDVKWDLADLLLRKGLA